MDQIRIIAKARSLVIEADKSWSDYSQEETAEALAKIEALDGDLLSQDFSSPEAKVLALEILLVGDDEPNFADDFKNKLFHRLRDFPPAE